VYATLVVGRVKYDAVLMTVAGERLELRRAEASDEYERSVVRPLLDEFKSRLQAARRARAELERSAVIREEVEVVGERIGLRHVRYFADEVDIGDETFEVDPGTAKELITEVAEERHPDPEKPDVESFDAWFKREAKTIRTWRAELLTGEGVEPIDLPVDVRWGYPVQGVMQILDELAREGWNLVHVSEDRGIYQGADAPEEAFLTRVRYLLQKRG
jgi:hypothetical protein